MCQTPAEKCLLHSAVPTQSVIGGGLRRREAYHSSLHDQEGPGGLERTPPA